MYQKSQSYVCVLRYGVQQTEFFVIMDRFLNPENQNFEKMKKTLEDIIILQMFTLNDSHMIYGFSDMKCNRQTFLSFWTVFCPFTPPLTTRKIKILKNWNKPLGISSFYTSILSLSNSRRHLANANVIADMISKIIVSRWHFFANLNFSATSEVQNYQNKTGGKYLYPSKYMLTTYFREF